MDIERETILKDSFIVAVINHKQLIYFLWSNLCSDSGINYGIDGSLVVIRVSCSSSTEKGKILSA